MTTRNLAIAVAIAIASIGAAHAETKGAYAGVSYSQITGDGGSFGSFKPSTAVFTLGYAVSPNWAFEGRLGTNASTDTHTFGSVSIDTKVDNFYALYAKGILPVGDSFGAYGLLGYNDMKVTASGLGVSASDSHNGGSFGVGMDFAISKQWILNAEWARHFSDTTSASLGLMFRF